MTQSPVASHKIAFFIIRHLPDLTSEELRGMEAMSRKSPH